MSPRPFDIVDVFAERPLAGNQLAVVRDAGDLPATAMQAIAREFNFSETTFVLAGAPNERGWPVRIFTPSAELPFAGHPTLGTAWVIRERLLGGGAGALVLDLAVGPIAVRAAPDDGGEVLWMRQRAPSFGARVEPAAAAAALGLAEADIDPGLPAQEVSTGLPFLIVPLASLEALRRARVQPERCDALLAPLEAEDVMVVARGGRDDSHQLSARVFAPAHGVPEDPATGSANGCLAGWLSRHRALGGDRVEVTVGQGHEIGRPSLLRLRAWTEGESIAVEVGGRVCAVAEGRLL